VAVYVRGGRAGSTIYIHKYWSQVHCVHSVCPSP